MDVCTELTAERVSDGMQAALTIALSSKCLLFVTEVLSSQSQTRASIASFLRLPGGSITQWDQSSILTTKKNQKLSRHITIAACPVNGLRTAAEGKQMT